MRDPKTALAGVLVAATLGVWACTDAREPSVTPDVPGQAVQTSLSPDQQRELDDIQKKLAEVQSLDAAGFAARYAVPFRTELGYDPLSAAGMPLIQSSALALVADEQAALAKNGFVVTDRKRFPSFVYGYQSIYTADLPVYISADSILYAVHESYDNILKTVEQLSLAPTLQRMLDTMAARLASGAAADLPETARRDVDFYLSVARSLAQGSFQAPTAGGDSALAKAFYESATAATGTKVTSIFGVQREIDFSQLGPRGHYTDTEELKRYFRATMWLGRIDLRLIETQPDHTQVFHRRQLEGALVLRALMDESARADWKKVDATIEAFVGEPDNMTLPQLDLLLRDLGVASGAELATRSDAQIAQAIVTGGYGTQRISSHIMVNGLGRGTMPLSSTFLLLGQRYVLDSHVFSNVVYDRVREGAVKRMMPNPLDVGFAALRNDHAGLLLGQELSAFGYAPDLASMRILADAHPPAFWEANLYNTWLTMLQTLSPEASEVADPRSAGLPSVAATEPWGRRMASTQLASWAELRHDTILYAKQSYTGAAACEYPDAYVEPYPELFARIGAFASRGAAVVSALDLGTSPAASTIPLWFGELARISGILETMAKNQRTGAPQSAEHLAFVNQMTFVDGCGSLSDYDGWYARLFFDKADAIELDPVVADVHTQPTDEGGSPVGKVLHVGTGMPRTMVVTVETCSGPRAYVGLASSYFEKVTENFVRLTDETWKKDIQGNAVSDVPWMKDLVVR